MLPKIMNPRTRVVAGAAQANPTRQVVEGPVHRGDLQTAPMIGEEKGRGRCVRHQAVPSSGIRDEDVPRGRMERNQPRLVEFGLADREQTFVKIDIAALQADRLADADPTHHQQPEETVICPRAKASGGRQRLRRRQ